MNKQNKFQLKGFSWIMRHSQAFMSSFQRIRREPANNLMTIAVIGIALALPACFYLLLQNIQAVSRGWDDHAQISLFLKAAVNDTQAMVLTQQLQMQSDIAKATYISPEVGLKAFERGSGLKNVLQQLHQNPLPGVIIVEPAAKSTNPFAIQQLLNRLTGMPEVLNAKLDLEWIKRLYALIYLGQRGVFVLGILLSLAVILIIGNSVHMAVQNQRREIIVEKLIGATHAYIRRPFLYLGFWYGLLGALLAYLFVNLVILGLSGPISYLSDLYQSSFILRGFNLFSTEVLFVISIILGVSGAWIAVRRQLGAIEPE